MAKKTKKNKKSSNDNEGTTDITAALEGIAGEWGSTGATEGFAEVPEGKYQCQITKSEVAQAKSSGRLQVAWGLKIVNGPCMNRQLFKYDGIDSGQSIGYFKGGVAKLGMEVSDDITELPDLLEELIGTFCQVSVKIRGDFTNVYFDKALDDDEVELGEDLEEEEEVEEEGEDGDEEEEEEEEDYTPSKGDRVTSEEYGEDEEGEVTKVVKKKETATVKFDDGTVETYPWSELSLIGEEEEEEEEEEDEDEEEEEVEEDEDEDEDEESVTLSFDKLTSTQKKVVHTIAKNQDFDPSDYDSDSELMGDVAEYLGISGSFAKADVLLKAMKKADKAS